MFSSDRPRSRAHADAAPAVAAWAPDDLLGGDAFVPAVPDASAAAGAMELFPDFAADFEGSVVQPLLAGDDGKKVGGDPVQLARFRAVLEKDRPGKDVAERLHLGRLVVGALDRRRKQDGNRLLASLASMASELRTSPPSLETELLRASFLVGRRDADAFRKAAEAAEVDGVRLLVRVTGPTPPWSFVGSEPANVGGRR